MEAYTWKLDDLTSPEYIENIDGFLESWLALKPRLASVLPEAEPEGDVSGFCLRCYARLRLVLGDEGPAGFAEALLLTQYRLQIAKIGQVTPYYIYKVLAEDGDGAETRPLIEAWTAARLLTRAMEALWLSGEDDFEPELPGREDCLRSAAALRAALADFRSAAAPSDYSPETLAAYLIALAELFAAPCGEFFAARELCLTERRLRVNSVEECVRLALECEIPYSDISVAVFSHGTCVLIAPDEAEPGETLEDAARHKLEEAPLGLLEFMDLDETSSGGDSLSCAYQSFELGRMNGIYNYFWSAGAERWRDEEIVAAHRAYDAEHQEIFRLVSSSDG